MGVRTLGDMKGITVGGVPLKEHLEEEHSDEIQDAYNDEMRNRSKAKGRVTRKDKRPVKEGVSKRVRRLTSDEIRREYGIMEKKHTREEGGVGADCLWLIRHKSPMTANKAAEILGKTRATTSGIFSQLYNALGGKYIERGVTLPYEYRPLEEFDHIFAYSLVRKFYATKSRDQRAKARGESPEPPPSGPIPDGPEPKEVQVVDPGDLSWIQDELSGLRTGLMENNAAIEGLISLVKGAWGPKLNARVDGKVEVNVNFRWVS